MSLILMSFKLSFPQFAQYGTLLAMVHHYQELFNVKSMDGIYPSMSIIYRQLQEATTARRNLYDILGNIIM